MYHSPGPQNKIKWIPKGKDKQTRYLRVQFQEAEAREKGNEREPKLESASLNWLEHQDEHFLLLLLKDTFPEPLLDV